MARAIVTAKHFTRTRGRTVELVVIHDMEAPEKSTTAESCARFFATTSRTASAHYCVDDDSIVQCVREQDVAFHAPGANRNGIGIELAGFARQSAAEWADAYSEAVLRRAAGLVAQVCARHDIPVRLVDVAGLKAGRRGITTHALVSKAFRKSSHTDPGKGFPMAHFLELVRTAGDLPKPRTIDLRDAAPPPSPPAGGGGGTAVLTAPLLRLGARSVQVVRLRARLDRTGPWQLGGSQEFDVGLEQAVRGYQLASGLVVDGIVGPRTSAALDAAKPVPVLRRGAKGAAVARLQIVLGLKADGGFGPVTERAVLAAQAKAGLAADAVVGVKTWAALARR